MITYMMYTYQEDGDTALISLRHLCRLCPAARIVVIDDACRPMQRAYADAIRALGCELRFSTHPRYGNLLGTEHALYHAQTMLALAPGKADIIVKLDPDTLIFDTAWVDALAADPDAVLAGGYKVHVSYIMGLTYAVKGVMLPDYLRDVERFPAWLRGLEDFEVGSRIYRLTDADPYAIHRYNVNGSDGWIHIDYRMAGNMQQQLRTCAVFNGGAFDRTSGRAGMQTCMNQLIALRTKGTAPCTTRP